MSYKHVFKLSDFCESAKFIYNEYKELEENLNEFLTKKIDTYYAGNPFVSLFIYGSKFSEGTISYDSLVTGYSNKLKIKPNYLGNTTSEVLTLKEYTLPLFDYLNKFFISTDLVTANVIWWYSYDVDVSKIKDDAILSKNITSNMFYRNSIENFNRIFITGNTSILPVKSYFLSNFNLKENDLIECEIVEAKGDSFSYISGGVSNFNNPIVIQSGYINILDKECVSDLLNQDNIVFFIQKDLSNVEELYVESDEVEKEADNTVLSSQSISNAVESLKNIDDYQIDSSYVIENSYTGNDVLTAKKAVSIIKTHIEEHYIQIINDIISEKQTTDIGRLIEYYKVKIEELEANYLFLKNHTLSSFYNRNAYCLEKTNPMTFSKQIRCADSNVSIEVSNRALTKGVFKRWLIQCINDRIPI